MESKAFLARLRSAIRKFVKYVAGTFGHDLDFKKKDVEQQMRDILNMPIADLLGQIENREEQKETNFDKKYQEVKQKLDKGGDDVLSLQEIEQLTNTLLDDIRQGNRPLVFERIPLKCLQSGLGEQRTLAEALTITALKSRRASRSLERDGKVVTSEERISRDGSNTQMELDLMAYAKEKGLWFDDPIAAMDKRYGRENRIGQGQESTVWADEQKAKAIKVKNTGLYETLEEFLEGVVLNNWLFEDSRQTIIGFGYDQEGLFRVVYETPYVEKTEFQEMTDEQKDEHLAKFGFVPKKDGSHHTYTNGVFEVRDMHNQNIVSDSYGNVRVIDPVIKWEAGEHYRERTTEEAEQDERNEQMLDDMFADIEFSIGSPDPSDISAKTREVMEKKKEKALEADPMATKPAQRLDNLARLIYENQDNTIGLKILQDKLNLWRKEKGEAPIPDSQDVRSQLIRSRSIAANKINLFWRHEGKKLSEVISRLSERISESDLMTRFAEDDFVEESANGEKFHYNPTARDLLERYVIARDNIERAEMKEAGVDIAPRGEKEFAQRMGVSMAEYVDIMQGVLTEDEINELWDAIRACTRFSLNVLHESGRISEDAYNSMMERQFYAPEKNFAQEYTNEDLEKQRESNLAARKGGKRGLAASAVAHKAKGGDSMAANVFETIIADVQNSIAVSEDNKVRQAMFNLLSDNKDYCEHYKDAGAPRVSVS